MVDFVHMVPIAASPGAVYAAIATQKGMRGWWTRDTSMTARVKGRAEFGFDKRSAVFRMKIVALKPGKAVKMTCIGGPPEWVGTKLDWSITRAGKATILEFRHRNWRRVTPFAASCNSMWGRLMFRIKDYAETGKPKPQWKK